MKIKIKKFKSYSGTCYNIELYKVRKNIRTKKVYQDKYESISLTEADFKNLLKEMIKHGTRSTKRKEA